MHILVMGRRANGEANRGCPLQDRREAERHTTVTPIGERTQSKSEVFGGQFPMLTGREGLRSEWSLLQELHTSGHRNSFSL